MMRAPSPVLICAATKDFFDIGGTWDTFRYAKRLYTPHGLRRSVDILENDAGHNYNTIQREGVARWMSRWLLGKDQPITEPPITLLTEKEYQCTPDGKVMSLPGARSVYDLNEDYENELAKRRTSAWATGDRTALLDQVRRLAGIRKLSELPKPQVEARGDGCAEGIPHREAPDQARGRHLAAGAAVPAREAEARPRRAVRSRTGQGGRRGPDGPIERLVQAGESGSGRRSPRDGPDPGGLEGGYLHQEFQDAYIAYLLGRSYVGMRAEDVLVCARYAAERAAGGREGTVQLVAVGNVLYLGQVIRLVHWVAKDCAARTESIKAEYA